MIRMEVQGRNISVGEHHTAALQSKFRAGVVLLGVVPDAGCYCPGQVRIYTRDHPCTIDSQPMAATGIGGSIRAHIKQPLVGGARRAGGCFWGVHASNGRAGAFGERTRATGGLALLGSARERRAGWRFWGAHASGGRTGAFGERIQAAGGLALLESARERRAGWRFLGPLFFWSE